MRSSRGAAFVPRLETIVAQFCGKPHADINDGRRRKIVRKTTDGSKKIEAGVEVAPASGG
jgi:hypothetical protein